MFTDLNGVFTDFERFFYLCSQAINFVNETNPLKVFKTVKDTSAIDVSQI